MKKLICAVLLAVLLAGCVETEEKNPGDMPNPHYRPQSDVVLEP